MIVGYGVGFNEVRSWRGISCEKSVSRITRRAEGKRTVIETGGGHQSAGLTCDSLRGGYVLFFIQAILLRNRGNRRATFRYSWRNNNIAVKSLFRG